CAPESWPRPRKERGNAGLATNDAARLLVPWWLAQRCARSAWSLTYAPGAAPRSALGPGSKVPPEKLPLRRPPTPDPGLSSPAATAIPTPPCGRAALLARFFLNRKS